VSVFVAMSKCLISKLLRVPVKAQRVVFAYSQCLNIAWHYLIAVEYCRLVCPCIISSHVVSVLCRSLAVWQLTQVIFVQNMLVADCLLQ